MMSKIATPTALHTTATTALLALLAISAAANTPETIALGEAGTVYEVRTGTHGDLLGGDPTVAALPVLAVEIASSDGTISRTLVPGTDDPAIEQEPVLLYDRGREALSVLWERATPAGVSLHLARFDVDGWSEPHELVAATAEEARARALTRNRHDWSVAGGESVSMDRAILHLVARDGSTGINDIGYTPLIFLEGTYLGWSDRISLLDTFSVDPAIPDGTPASPLANTHSVVERADGAGLFVAFTDSRSGHVVVLEVAIQPLDLIFFSAEVRLGLQAIEDDYQAGSAVSIQGPVRAEIINGGRHLGLNESLVIYIADTVDAWATAWAALNPDADFQTFSSALMSLIDDLILAVFTNGDADGQTIVIDLGDPTDTTVPSQLLEVSVAFAATAPETGPHATRIYPSADGRRVLIGWYDYDQDTVYYRESTGDEAEPWTPIAALQVTERLPLERIDALLRARVH